MNNDSGTPPSEIIGKTAMHGFASHLRRYSEEMDKMKSECLIKFCEENTFDSSEYEHFQRGVATVLQFFLACESESQMIKAKTEKGE